MKLKSILLVSASMLMFGNSYGQSKVTTGGKKYTLMEEGTGTWCQWCTDGAQVIQEDIVSHGSDTNYTRAIAASFHNGASDSMTLAGDPYNSSTGYITGFPMGTVDRAPYPSSTVGLSRGSWPAAVGARNGLTPNFDVSMECVYDDSTRVISIKVTAKALVALTGFYRMSAYICEDSIPSNKLGYRQQNASGLNSGGTPSASSSGVSWFIGKGTTIQDSMVYSHMDVVRKILASSIWGDTAFNNPTVGKTVTKTYSYTIPATIKNSICHPKYTKVIGMVMKYGTSTNDRAIENSIGAKVRWMKKSVVGVEEVSHKMLDVELFPNPASTSVVVRGTLENPSNTRIAIYNVLGQIVFEKEYEAGGSLFGERIPLYNISNGTYIMTIANEGETITKRFVVSK